MMMLGLYCVPQVLDCLLKWVLKLYTSIYQFMKKKNVYLYLISESKVMPFFCFVLTFWTNMLWQMFDNACKTYFWLIFIIFIMLNMYLCSARRRNLEADRRNWKYMISRPSQIPSWFEDPTATNSSYRWVEAKL